LRTFLLEMTAVTAGNVNFRWDPKSLEIRTLAVERLLEPLVTQVKEEKGVGSCLPRDGYLTEMAHHNK